MQNIALYIASVLIWGSTWYVIHFQLGAVHPMLSVCYRFALSALILFLFCAATGRTRHRFTRNQHLFIAMQGFLLFCFNYWLTYTSTTYITSGLVALCFSTMTIMNIFGQFLLFKKPVDKQVIFGATLGLLGMALVFTPEIERLTLHDNTFKGVLLCLTGTLMASLGNMASYRNARDDMPILLTITYGMAYGAFFSAVIAFLLGADLRFEMTAPYIVSLLYLSVFGSVITFVCYLTLLSNIGADRAGYVAVLIPVVALAISTVLENYHWSLFSVSGVIMILIGNVIAMQSGNPFASLKRLKRLKNWRLFKGKPS